MAICVLTIEFTLFTKKSQQLSGVSMTPACFSSDRTALQKLSLSSCGRTVLQILGNVHIISPDTIWQETAQATEGDISTEGTAAFETMAVIVTTNRGAKVRNEASRQQVVDVNQEPLVDHLVICHQQDDPLTFAAGLQNSAPMISFT